MPDRILYIPWTRASGLADQFINNGAQWNASSAQTHNQHTYDVVCYGDANAKTIIRGLPWGHRIYVQGHGGAGDHSIEADAANRLTYNEVADRLIADGLQKRWAGVIVCDSCQSAVPTMGMQAYARKFADYMRLKGYLLISFIGYFGPVDAIYNRQKGLLGDDPKYDHRYVTVFGKEVKSKWTQIHL